MISSRLGSRSLRSFADTSLRSLPRFGFCCSNMPRACSMTPVTTGCSTVVVARKVRISFAIASEAAVGVGCASGPGACARAGPANTATASPAATNMRMVMAAVIDLLPLDTMVSGSLDDAYGVGAGKDGGVSQADEQAVLDHAGNGRQPGDERLRIADPAERRVED